MRSAPPIDGLRVGFVKQEFVPEQAVVSRQIIESLCDRGAQVRVITGTATTAPGSRAAGAPIVRPVREQWRGIEILRLPFWPTHDRSSVRRMATYASFSASSTVAGPWALRDLDVVLVYGSPVTAAAAPLAWTRALGLPYVLHVQDLWPDSVFATGFVGPGRAGDAVKRTMEMFVKAAYRRAAAVIAITPGMRSEIVRRGVPAAKVHAIYNWTDESVFRPAEPVDHDGRVLMYAGSLGLAQDLGTLISAMGLLSTPSVRLLMVGDGPAAPALRAQVDAQGLTNVEFLGRIPPPEARDRMRGADLHLVMLADEPLFRITMPSKVQSLMASGVPVVVSAPGEAGVLVETAGAGLAVAPGDPRGLAAAIDSMLSRSPAELRAMGARGAAFYGESCSAERGSAALAEVLVASSRVKRTFT